MLNVVLKSEKMKWAAALLLSVAVPFPSAVFAATDMADVGASIQTQVLTLPNLISAICYVTAVVLAAKGIIGLREHAESPANHKISPPMAKLFACVALFALPSFGGWAQKTLSFGGSNGANLKMLSVISVGS